MPPRVSSERLPPLSSDEQQSPLGDTVAESARLSRGRTREPARDALFGPGHEAPSVTGRASSGGMLGWMGRLAHGLRPRDRAATSTTDTLGPLGNLATERPRNKLRKPPPATPLSERVKRTPWYAHRAAAAQAQAPATPIATGHLQANSLETADNEGWLLDGGRVHQWNHVDGAWQPTATANADLLKLGADGQAYLRKANSAEVIPMSTLGQSGHRLFPDATDFIVLPSGAMVELRTLVLAASSSSQLAPPVQVLSWHAKPGPDGIPAPIPRPLPLPPALGSLRSIALTNDGQLYAVDEGGRVCRASVDALATGRATARWTEVDTAALPPQRRLEALRSMADGTLVGIDQQGAAWPADAAHRGWVPRPANPPPSLHALYARFRPGPVTDENTTIGFLPPGGEKLRVKDKNRWKPSFMHRDHEGQKLLPRYADWLQSHVWRSPKAGTHVRAEVEADWQSLRQLAVGSMRASPRLRGLVEQTVGHAVNANARQALDVMEEALGFTPQHPLEAPPGTGLPDTAAFLKVRDPALARTDANVLWQVLQLRESLHPDDSADAETQAVTRRLRRLVNAGVHLPVKGSRRISVVREPGRPPRFRKLRNPFAALTGKLVHDHAVTVRAVRDAVDRVRIGRGNGGAHQAATSQDIRALLAAQAENVDGGPDNHITGFFRQQVVDLEAWFSHGTAWVLDQELKDHRRELMDDSVAVPPMAPAVAVEIGTLVAANAHEALDRLDAALGRLNPDGTPNPAFRKHKAVHAPNEAKVRSDDNALHLLHRQWTAMWRGTADPQALAVAQRLQALLHEGVYLQTDSARHVLLAADERKRPRLHLVKNKAAVPVAKLMHDFAVLKRACRRVAGRSPEASLRFCEEQAGRVEGGDGNRITALFQKGFVNLDRAKRGLEAMDYTLKNLARPGHPMHRALVMQGALRDEDPADAYVLAWQKMQPGDSIRIGKTGMVGLDGDGLTGVFRTSDRGTDGIGHLSVKFNPIPNVQPVPCLTAIKEHSFSMVKKHNGLELAFGKATEAEVKIAAKLMWGAGAYATLSNQQLTGVLYAGVEVIPGLGIAIKADNTVTLQVTQDDDGRVQRLIRDILHGVVSPFDLLAVSMVAKTRRTVTQSLGGTVDVQGLVAAVGILGFGQGGDNRGKAILASLAQLNMTAKKTWGRSTEEGPDGRTTTLVDKFESTGNAKWINLAELQFSHLDPTRNPQYDSADPKYVRDGQVVGETVTDGRENEYKIPVFIKVLGKNLWGKEVATDGISIKQDTAGRITGVDMVVHTQDAPMSKMLSKMNIHKARRGARAFNERNIVPLAPLMRAMPELESHIRKISQAGLQAQALLELTPAALALVKTWQAQMPADRLQARIKELVENPANLRVAEISANSTHAYKTGAFFGATLLRLKSGAENALTTHRAKIKVTYADDGQPQPHLSGDLLLGKNAQPDFKQAERILAEGGSAHLRWLDDPVGNDPERRFLARLPQGRTRPDGTATRAARTIVKPLPQADAAGGVAHIGLENGHLVYRQPLPAGGWRQVDVPPAIRTALIPHLDRQVFGRIGNDSALLTAMSLGETGVLGPASMAGGHLAALRRLADNRMVVAAHHARPRDGDRTGRSLHVSDILADLRSTRLAGLRALDAAQQHVLGCYFPAAGGGMDEVALARVLNDPDQLNMFDAGVRRFVDGSGPAPVVRPTGPGSLQSDDRMNTLAMNTVDNTTSVNTHSAT